MKTGKGSIKNPIAEKSNRTRAVAARRILVSCLLVLASSNLYAAFGKGDAGTSAVQFLKMGAGARSAGMGDIGVGVSEGASSVYWNAAGLAGMEKPAINMMHAVWFEDIGYSWLGYGQPIAGIGVIGVGVQYISYGSIRGSDTNGLLGGSFNPIDMAATLGYGGRISDDLSLGFGAKYISSRIKKTGTAYAGDAGLLYRPGNGKMTLGLAVQNVGSKIKYEDAQENLPMTIRVGGGYNIRAGWLAGLDVTAVNDSEIAVGVGSEYKYAASEGTRLTGRAGYNTKTKDLSGLKGLSMGAGIEYQDYGLDYAFVPFGDLGNTHSVSLNIKF